MTGVGSSCKYFPYNFCIHIFFFFFFFIMNSMLLYATTQYSVIYMYTIHTSTRPKYCVPSIDCTGQVSRQTIFSARIYINMTSLIDYAAEQQFSFNAIQRCLNGRKGKSERNIKWHTSLHSTLLSKYTLLYSFFCCCEKFTCVVSRARVIQSNWAKAMVFLQFTLTSTDTSNNDF